MEKEDFLKNEKNKAIGENEKEKSNFEDKKYNKNKENYVEEVWEDFLKFGSNDFESYMGYGPKEIKNISDGVSKFIKAMDWNSLSDIMNKKWRTDLVKVVICGDCKNEFSTFNMDYGLCEECKKKYKIDEFEKSLEELEKKNEFDVVADSIISFTCIKDFRNFFKKMSFEEELKMLEDDNFLNAKTPNFLSRLIENNDKNNIDLVKKKIKEAIKVLENKNIPFDILVDTLRTFDNKSFDSIEKRKKRIFKIYYAKN